VANKSKVTDGTWVYVDKRGKFVIQKKSLFALPFSKGLAAPSTRGNGLVKQYDLLTDGVSSIEQENGSFLLNLILSEVFQRV
jgi:hypothetical protein